MCKAVDVVVSGADSEGSPFKSLSKEGVAGDAEPELQTTCIRLGESGTYFGNGFASYENPKTRMSTISIRIN